MEPGGFPGGAGLPSGDFLLQFRSVKSLPMQSAHQLSRSKTGLLVVDIQERLLPAMFAGAAVVQNSVRLIKGAAVLGLPVFATEQYRKGLGVTVPEVAAALGKVTPIEKMSFSACGAAGLLEGMKAREVSQVLLCGIETHVCVSQTALALLAAGLEVFAVADATSSRAPENHGLGLERMRDAGATVVSTEMALFELLEKAGTEEFKQILALVK
jgi:nicotinamidase-related amidase